MSQVTEDTPLLSDPTADESGSPHDEQLESTVARHQQRCAVAIFILTWLSAILDIVLIVLYGLMIAIHKSGFGKPIPWEQDIILNGLTFALMFAELISFLNLARLYARGQTMWIWLNLIFDFLIAYVSIIGSAYGLQDWGYESGGIVWVIGQILCGLGIILGLSHVALFFVRCFLAFTYRPWRGYRNWKFPSGLVSIEVKIQFLRQQEAPETSLEAATSGNGPQEQAVAQTF